MAEEAKKAELSIEEVLASTSIADVYQAAKQLDGVAKKTHLVESPYFSDLCGNNVYLKPENLQNTGSFKLRGAYNKISQLNENERKRGVITASAGNHAQGVAFAARALNCKAVICMPATTPILKVEATRAYGAEVVLYGDSFDDAYAKSLELQKKKGYVYIHPFNDQKVLAGQGTTALEIIDELKDVDAILVPIGGGGFASVEPEGAPCMEKSFMEGHVTTLSAVDTVADGCAVKTPGDLTYAFCKKYLDQIITVSEMEIMSALLSLIEKHKLIAEGAGALSSTISALIDKALIARGRVFCFSVQLPDKPGQLLHVSQVLADENANVIKLEHNQSKVTDSFKKVMLEVTVETHGHDHVQRIIRALENAGFVVDKIY